MVDDVALLAAVRAPAHDAPVVQAEHADDVVLERRRHVQRADAAAVGPADAVELHQPDLERLLHRVHRAAQLHAARGRVAGQHGEAQAGEGVGHALDRLVGRAVLRAELGRLSGACGRESTAGSGALRASLSVTSTHASASAARVAVAPKAGVRSLPGTAMNLDSVMVQLQ